MKKTRELAEMILFFCAFFLPGYLGQGAMVIPVTATNALMVQAILTGVPQFLLMAYVVIVAGSSPASRWGIVAFSSHDLLRTGMLIVGCFAVVTPFIALLVSLPPEVTRRLSRGFRWGLSSAAQVPLAVLFGLTAGYREEFFFRSYLLGRMEELGVPVPAAVAVSTALFCAGHLYEGLFAVGVTAALGLLLASAWLRRRNLHIVAIAHGAYNTLVLCIGLMLPRGLPDPAGLHIF